MSQETLQDSSDSIHMQRSEERELDALERMLTIQRRNRKLNQLERQQEKRREAQAKQSD